MKILKENTTEVYDRYGHYGEAGAVVFATLKVTETENGFATFTTLPDQRVVTDYEGNNRKEAMLIFDLIADSHAPEGVR